MNKELLKEIVVSNENYIKSIDLIVERECVKLPSSLRKVVIFYGVRRSGKTFILFNLYKKHKDNAVYIDFEDDRLQEFKLKDFEILKEAVLELKPDLINKKIVFLFDEVQNVDGWERFSRRVVERENANVFVSGSSSKMMPYEINTTLRGRSWNIEVLPFSFREYLRTKNMDPDEKKILYGKRKFVVKRYFLEFLKWGGFPEVSLIDSDFEKKKLLKEYLDAMFFKDLVERYKITNIKLLEALLDKLFSSFSTKVSLTSFYKQYKNKFPFSKDLLFRYYKHILESMLIFEVKKFSESVYKRTRNPAKVYLVDTGLAEGLISEDLGRRLENFAFLELKRRGYEIFYFEGKRECDFIVVKDGNFLPVQITYELNKENTEKEIEGLIEACKFLNKKRGIIITYDEERSLEIEGMSIDILPAWKWGIINEV